jgi:hypothetical protein
VLSLILIIIVLGAFAIMRLVVGGNVNRELPR